MNEYRECPYCGEKILQKAIKCRYCLSMLDNMTSDVFTPPPPPSPPPPMVFSPPAPDQMNKEPAIKGLSFVSKTNRQVVIPPPPPVYRTQALGVPVTAQASGDADLKSIAKVPPTPPPPSAAIAAVSEKNNRLQEPEFAEELPPPPKNINTPAKRMSEFPKASIIRRFLACILDFITVSIPLQLIFFLTPLMENLEMLYDDFDRIGRFVIRDEETFYTLLPMIAVLSLWSVYYLLIKDGLKKGRSWGKKIMGLMVVSLHTGKPCSKGRSFLRNFILLIPLMNIVFSLMEFIIVVSNVKGRRLGDMIAGTQVIKASEYHGQ